MFIIIDNYDSFVWNLADYVHQLGQKTLLIKNDLVTEQQIRMLDPTGIIISPGPKHPKDAGQSCEIIKKFSPTIPILGICLGHQAIGYHFGATIGQTEPCHGRASLIHHTEQGIFKNIQSPALVGRYHSLSIINDDFFPDCLEITAYSQDTNIIMGVKHKIYPCWGLQFHPESILTHQGLDMIRNFIELASEYGNKNIQIHLNKV